MADISDVSNALRDLIVSVLYPNGTGGSGGPAVPVKVYSGWPDPARMTVDIPPQRPATAHHISIFPLATERNTTRHPTSWQESALPPETYTINVVGQTFQIGGSAPDPYRKQNLAVFVDGRSYVVQATAGQTASALAAALAAQISPVWPGVTVMGGNLTLPTLARLGAARVGVYGEAHKLVSQQEKGFQVTIWTDTDANRTLLAKAIQPVLADTAFLTMPDGYGARLICRSNVNSDRSQTQGAYRRDLVYTVEYVTTRSMEAPEIVVAKTDIENPAGTVVVALEN